MKKWLSILCLGLLISSAFAETEAIVRITSYTYINQERKVAELCGVVLNQTNVPTHVQVTVDYNSKRPANYNTVVGPDGKFCTVVVTYYGTAIARLF